MTVTAASTEGQLGCESGEFVEEPDSEQEISSVTPDQTSSLVLYGTDWTVETILAQLERHNIDLNPRFQRRDAWTPTRKSRFIESLILGLPVPQIVLAEKKGQRGRFIVLDGKQRLLTLLQFTGKGEGKNNGFALTDLEVRRDLNCKGYEVLKTIEEAGDCDAFQNSTMRSVIIRNWRSEALLHMVFVRLNTGSVSLSPQELRQALFPGAFTDFVDDYSQTSPMLRLLFGSKEPDFRMRDVELLVRYLAFSYFLRDYSGDLREFLDRACDRLNQAWPDKSDDIQARVHEFENAVDTAARIFGHGSVGRKWTRVGGYEGRLNRAVLDVLVFYFSEPSVRQLADERPAKVKRAFEDICGQDANFLAAIETTTKSLRATYNRFTLWGKALSSVLGVALPIPTWNDVTGRINIADR